MSLDEGNYPDYKDILKSEGTEVILKGIDNGLQNCIRGMKEGGFVPALYMDITSIVEDMDDYRAYVHPDGNKPLVIIGEGFKGALMPIV